MADNILAEISRQDLQDLQTHPRASITDVMHLSSYNWIERTTPTIVVPGSPSLWTPPRGPHQVPKDSGYIFIAQNAARHPTSPLEPLFRAVYVQDPSFDIRSVDVVTDRNNLRKLLTFVNPGSTSFAPEPFTIRIEVTKDTAVFCREETSTSQFIGPNEFKGFGHEFEKAYTTTQIKDSTGHHRIISYHFAGLNFVVRYETDGYVNVKGETYLSSTAGSVDGGLSNLMGSLSLSSTNSPGVTPAESRLTVQEGGQTVPLESTLEIKTRSSKRPLQIYEVAPQLWISQTPKLVRAYHTSGTFQGPQVEDVAEQVKRWEQVNQGDLQKFAGLISKIIVLVKHGGGNATIRYDGGEKLVIQKATEHRMLPIDLYSKWDDGDRGQAHVAARIAVQKRLSSKGGITEDDKSAIFSSKDPIGTWGTQDNIPFGDAIDYGMKNGLRQFFRRMPLELSNYHDLCKALYSRKIDITEGRSIQHIMSDMRRGKSDWDPDERRQIEGQKGLARDSAFRLLYMILCDELRSGISSNVVYNAVLFVVSHRRIFMYRTRKIVREAFLEQFQITEKQQASLDKWPIEAASVGLQDEDVTTEEEFYDFDSDYSF